jgi:hypothetical protein
LVLFTSCDEFPCLPGAVPTTAPPHRLTSFPYHLRRDIPTNIPVPPIRENLILVSPGSPTMSPPTGSGSGKETPRSSDDITTRLDRLEELIHVVTSDLCDVKQQQQGLDVSLIRLEQNVYGSSGGVHAASATNATVAVATSGDQSVAPPPNGGNSRPSDGPRHRGMEGDANDEGLPTAHKIEFPKFDIIDDPLPWLNRCERYFCLRGIPEHKDSYASFYLLDDAQMWYHRLELNGSPPSWTHFTQLIQVQIGPSLTDSPIGELTLVR